MKKILIIALAALTATSCKHTEYVTVERVRTDTVKTVRNLRDSIYLHDSIRVTERNDTVTIERWHTRYRDRLLLDTIYESHTDSVPVPYPVEVEVERELTWWQRSQMYAGDCLLVLLLVGLLFRLKRRIL